MRRIAACLAALGLCSCLLAGCGPTSASYSDGFAVGQSVAAAEGAPIHAPLAACRRQWTVSGPATDARSRWIAGCVAGIRKLESTVGVGLAPAAHLDA
jgi:hypothetical protein